MRRRYRLDAPLQRGYDEQASFASLARRNLVREPTDGTRPSECGSCRGFRPRGNVARLAFAGLAALAAVPVLGCNYRHSAPVQAAELPPPPGKRVVHSSPLVVEVVPHTDDSQCVAYEGYRTLCFHGIRSALEKSLTQGLWPAFPRVEIGRLTEAAPGQYVLQVDAHLEALPPDQTGPGWSAGIQGRFRLFRDGELLAEEALASRSRAEFPYGAALGQAGSEVLDAMGAYVALAVAQVEEKRPLPSRPLPSVTARSLRRTEAALRAP